MHLLNEGKHIHNHSGYSRNKCMHPVFTSLAKCTTEIPSTVNPFDKYLEDDTGKRSVSAFRNKLQALQKTKQDIQGKIKRFEQRLISSIKKDY